MQIEVLDDSLELCYSALLLLEQVLQLARLLPSLVPSLLPSLAVLLEPLSFLHPVGALLPPIVIIIVC